MSGHSHYATIKRQKEAKDLAKGKIFSKMARIIAIAIKAGGGADPNTNYKLRMAIDQAKAANIPKANIDRILSRAQTAGDYEEVTYEGYGPEGVAVIVDVTTDNRNRTSQEIKNIFERGGGSLAGPGSVSFNFEPKALIVVQKETDVDSQILKIIDLGVEDVNESEDGIEVYVAQEKASETKGLLEKQGFKVTSYEIIKKPKSNLSIQDEKKALKIITFLDSLDDQDDVQNVYSNLDIPPEIAQKLSSG
jgi:YebC/PmpR family DNA-binding regulatory protein